MNLITTLLTFTMTLAQPLIPATQTDQEVIEIKFEIYKAIGHIKGDTSLTDDIKEGIDDSETVQKGINVFSVFVLADLTISGVRLKADENKWTWNDEEKPPLDFDLLKIVSNLKILNIPGNTFQIKIGGEIPSMQYFEKRSDGLFELKSNNSNNPIETGLFLSSRVEPGNGNRILFSEFHFKMTSIDSRKKIEGVDLDVGEPVINTKEVVTSLAIKPDCYYGMIISTKSRGYLILKIRASFRSPQDMPKE